MARWIELIGHAEAELLPRCHGRLVRRHCDGILAMFRRVRAALAAAFAVRHTRYRRDLCIPAGRHIAFRSRMEIADVLVVEQDASGHATNIAAWLTTSSGPAEIAVSARVREQLAPGIDSDIEDLGGCYRKQVRDSMRGYRVGPPRPWPTNGVGFSPRELWLVAIVPFTMGRCGP